MSNAVKSQKEWEVQKIEFFFRLQLLEMKFQVNSPCYVFLRKFQSFFDFDLNAASYSACVFAKSAFFPWKNNNCKKATNVKVDRRKPYALRMASDL